jgi:hypothetical protein
VARARPIALAALLAVAPLVGCGGGETSPGTTAPGPATEGPRSLPVSTAASQRPRPVVSPYRPGVLPRVVATLARQIGTTPRFVAVFVAPEDVVMVVQDPRDRLNLDQYTWRSGTITGPSSPTRRDPSDPPTVFTARQVRLGAVPGLVARARRLPLESPRVTGVVIQIGVALDDGLGFLVNVDGTRRGAQIVADARGRVQQIR